MGGQFGGIGNVAEGGLHGGSLSAARAGGAAKRDGPHIYSWRVIALGGRELRKMRLEGRRGRLEK